MTNYVKLLLFLSFVAVSTSQDDSKTKKETVISESGSVLITEAQPDPIKHPESSVETNENAASKKKDLKISEEGENVNPYTGIMPDSFDISGSTGISVLLFVSSLLVVFFIMYRACRMKQNRGERRYGGVMTSYQELSPITIEDDDSELEEQALFDINKARADQVVL